MQRIHHPNVDEEYFSEKNMYEKWVSSQKKNATTASPCGSYYESFQTGGKNWLYFNHTFRETPELVQANKIDLDFDGNELVNGKRIEFLSEKEKFEDTLSMEQLNTRPELKKYDPTGHSMFLAVGKPNMVTENKYINDKKIGTDCFLAKSKNESWMVLDHLDGMTLNDDKYTAYAVRLDDPIKEHKAELYKIELPIIHPEGKTLLDRIGGESPEISSYKSAGKVYIDTEKIGILKRIERDLKENVGPSVQVLSVRQNPQKENAFSIAALCEKYGEQKFATWQCYDKPGQGYMASRGHYYDNVNFAMLDHICSNGGDLTSNKAALESYGTDKSLADFESSKNIHAIKKVTDYIQKAAKKVPDKIPFLANLMRKFTDNLAEKRQIHFTSAQKETMDAFSDVAWAMKLYDEKHKHLCEKALSTACKAIDTAAKRQQGR